MTGKIAGAMLKKGLIAATTGLLQGASYVLDKGAELADEAHDYVEALGKEERDVTGREQRQEKRNSPSE